MTIHRNAVTKLFAIRFQNRLRRAIEVCVKNGNVYVTSYDRQGKDLAHTSQHASGQRHFKVKERYVQWTGGPSGQWEPMIRMLTPPKKVIERAEIAFHGWAIDSIPHLPEAKESRDVVIFECPEQEMHILMLGTSVVGPHGKERNDRDGFPVLWRHRFSHGITIEVEAIAIYIENEATD